MDRYSWRKGCGLAALLLLIASMLSFDLHDPTITNLRYPKDGIANLAGLPGALVGGSLVELLGASSLWIPALLANWMLIPYRQRNLGPYLLFSGAGTLFSAALHGTLAENIIPGLTAPGLAGIAGSRWMLRTMDATVAAPLLAAALLFSLAQLLRMPLLGAAFRDGRMIVQYFGRKGLAHATEVWALQRAAARRVRGYFRRRVGARGFPGNAGGDAGDAPGRGTARITHRQSGHPGKPPATAGGNSNGGSPPGAERPGGSPSPAAGGMMDKGGFGAWIAAVGKPEQGAGPEEKP